jgi:DNA modification methylase
MSLKKGEDEGERFTFVSSRQTTPMKTPLLKINNLSLYMRSTDMDTWKAKILNTDCVEGAKLFLPDESVDLVCTDPPWAIGEENFDNYYGRKRDVIGGYIPAPSGRAYYDFSLKWLREAYRVLKPYGSLYTTAAWSTGHHLQLALEDAGFFVINELVWDYGNSAYTLTKYNNVHFKVLYCAKTPKYKKLYFDPQAIFYLKEKEWHKLKRDPHYADTCSVWRVRKHFKRGKKTYKTQLPEALVEKMILYSSKRGDFVVDFFFGSGTIPVAAYRLNRRVMAFERNSVVYPYACKRLQMTEPEHIPEFNLAFKIGSPEFLDDFEKRRKRYIPHFQV